MSYRPITDVWFLTRAKLKDGKKYYGAYLGGFPERARVLIGCSLDEPMLHVCGGMAKFYPYERGLGKYDMTLDIDPATEPDFLRDARKMFPQMTEDTLTTYKLWSGILIDSPYSEEDAEHYLGGRANYPPPNLLVKNGIEAVAIGRKVGIIHYIVPQCPKNAKFVACVGVVCGFNNRIRVFSVYERIS